MRESLAGVQTWGMPGTQRKVGIPGVAQGYRCEAYGTETANERLSIWMKSGIRKSGAQGILPEYGNLVREALQNSCVKKNDTSYQTKR